MAQIFLNSSEADLLVSQKVIPSKVSLGGYLPYRYANSYKYVICLVLISVFIQSCLSNNKIHFEELKSEFIEAVKANDISKVKDLLKNKIYSQEKDAALILAASYGYGNIVNILLDNGSNPNASVDDTFALYEASVNGRTEIVEILLQHNADINMRNKSGRTSLMGASIEGHKEVVKCLLDNNAETSLKEIFRGFTALDLAFQRGHKEIANLIINYAKSKNSSPLPAHDDKAK